MYEYDIRGWLWFGVRKEVRRGKPKEEGKNSFRPNLVLGQCFPHHIPMPSFVMIAGLR
jgi:hypothetical protein